MIILTERAAQPAPRTVAVPKYGMMTKLGIKSSAELLQYAIKQHLVSV